MNFQPPQAENFQELTSELIENHGCSYRFEYRDFTRGNDNFTREAREILGGSRAVHPFFVDPEKNSATPRFGG